MDPGIQRVIPLVVGPRHMGLETQSPGTEGALILKVCNTAKQLYEYWPHFCTELKLLCAQTGSDLI